MSEPTRPDVQEIRRQAWRYEDREPNSWLPTVEVALALCDWVEHLEKRCEEYLGGVRTSAAMQRENMAEAASLREALEWCDEQLKLLGLPGAPTVESISDKE